MLAKFILQDGTIFQGKSFGAEKSVSGEAVFATGMMGYPESLTDPSYKGQILILTYPLIGNYGIPDRSFWEANKIMVSGLIVSNYIDTPSHFQSKRTLAAWFQEEEIPLLEIKDTRLLTQIIRDKGAVLSKIIFKDDVSFYNPNNDNLVKQVSIKKPTTKGDGSKTIVLLDCGAKKTIEKKLLMRHIKVITIPWDYDPFEKKIHFDALVISNGPGDPKMADKTINIVKKVLEKKTPILGICLGHQILALAAGGNTKKLKYGHRSQNQPCLLSDTKRCYITTQNHGYAVDVLPNGFTQWFTNANDGTNEGMYHTRYPFMSVQFHPEATPGPTDAEWIFDYFLKRINRK